jgi:hypothetical protein
VAHVRSCLGPANKGDGLDEHVGREVGEAPDAALRVIRPVCQLRIRHTTWDQAQA